LKARGFDAAIVPGTVSTSFTSDLLAYLSGAPVRMGVRSLEGKENPSGFLFNVGRDLDWQHDPHRHQTLRNADIMGGLIPAPEDLQCALNLTTEELERGKEWFRTNGAPDGIRIALHPGAGKPPNRWPASRFAEAANVLTREYGASVYITEGPMDKAEVEAVQSTLNEQAQVIKNTPIRDVASILSCVDLVLSNDTGVMHVAAAAGVPVVSLFGPTDPLQWAPVGPGNRWIKSRGEQISDIGLEEVLKACRELLGPPRGEGK
jgi:heptosyltransferase-2